MHFRFVDNLKIYDTNDSTFLCSGVVYTYYDMCDQEEHKVLFYVSKKGTYFGVQLPAQGIWKKSYSEKRATLKVFGDRKNMLKFIQTYCPALLEEHFAQDLEEA